MEAVSEINYPSVEDLVGSDLLSRMSIKIAKVLSKKKLEETMNFIDIEDENLSVIIKKMGSASLDPQHPETVLEYNGWKMQIMENDPRHRITVGKVWAEKKGTKFTRHEHTVSEWVFCYSGAVEIIDYPSKKKTVLTEEDKIGYHITPGKEHSGISLTDNTKLIFVNKPAEKK